MSIKSEEQTLQLVDKVRGLCYIAAVVEEPKYVESQDDPVSIDFCVFGDGELIGMYPSQSLAYSIAHNFGGRLI